MLVTLQQGELEKDILIIVTLRIVSSMVHSIKYRRNFLIILRPKRLKNAAVIKTFKTLILYGKSLKTACTVQYTWKIIFSLAAKKGKSVCVHQFSPRERRWEVSPLSQSYKSSLLQERILYLP